MRLLMGPLLGEMLKSVSLYFSSLSKMVCVRFGIVQEDRMCARMYCKQPAAEFVRASVMLRGYEDDPHLLCWIPSSVSMSMQQNSCSEGLSNLRISTRKNLFLFICTHFLGASSHNESALFVRGYGMMCVERVKPTSLWQGD